MKRLIPYCIVIFLLCLVACTCPVDYTEMSEYAAIYPDYQGTVIPYNIAPLNFRIQAAGDKFYVRFVSGTDSFDLTTHRDVSIPLKKWKKLLSVHKGKDLQIQVFAKENGTWKKYQNRVFRIAADPVDAYLAYRLIEPGYASWNKMGIYQRCVENFDETPIMLNTLTGENCMNCHTFHQKNPDKMLFHLRGKHGGTLFVQHGEVKKVNLQLPWMVKAGVYPRWHPGGRYVAFSTNSTTQGFLATHINKIEVYDTSSDIIMYDTEKNRIFSAGILRSENSYETFPEWSPDGRYLYFCTSPALPMPNSYKELKYSLVRVAFDPATETFSTEADTLVSAWKTGKSVSMPRVSVDGKYLVFCQFDYGTFPIWHRENDLYLLNTATGESENMTEVNSNETDSYHSWSSNGRWLVFSSRRLDGAYTRPFIAYFDTDGKFHKPFLLPQKTPDYYDYLMKSYNIPEWITGKVEVSPYQLAKTAWGEAITPTE
ncbi:MAG: Protein TolB [Candidatus Ordinivivax streblomastigis]|uniref:Protein TolB n=1 Tax=Candidatus Ordinivivax streblomastigis TaxID=2540710 RepID=A0A5M8P4Q6_9BACT|nr:MAG: Protein TolB [Candidatus Ordinivivax streblomastigis]KAA6303354.1 MAG: Protein TolB [Candidatus Ordinivivax streblomastigis]